MRPLLRAAARDLRRRHLDQWWPPRPTTINLLANDHCNSRCTMCNIWRRDPEPETDPDALERILRDPLFARVTAVGITGGEPTLRADLPDLFAACCRALPRLAHLSLITNAIEDDAVIERVGVVREILRRYERPLTVMVSLDGVGAVHDRVRGTPGNFDSALRVIRHLRDHTDVELLTGTTISKRNVWDVDAVLELLQGEGVYGRFRVAEFIRRLYNFGRESVIRAFDGDESYHLAVFFHRLEKTYERKEFVRRTYRNVRAMLLGAPRRMGCPYQTTGVVLDSRGGLQYCAPESHTLGDTHATSARRLWRRGLRERRRILRERCAGCIHDYHAAPTLGQEVQRIGWEHWHGVMTLDHAVADRLPASIRAAAATAWVAPRRDRPVLIVGWYGTETVGDKAILTQLLAEHRGRRIVVASIHPFVTERTRHELDADFDVVPAYGPRMLQLAASAAEVVMGGGPLMHIGDLALPLIAFRVARQRGVPTRVHGCGIGPLRSEPHRTATRMLLEHADVVSLRDWAAVRAARTLGYAGALEVIEDPAATAVREARTRQPRASVIPCFLREWPREYAAHLSEREFARVRGQFEAGVADLIADRAAEHQAAIHLHPMHTMSVGGDDRIFMRRFVRDHLESRFAGEIVTHERPSTFRGIIDAMQTAAHAVCMRYHSVVFAVETATPFTAIDYTLGGKVRGYLEDQGMLDRMVTVAGLCAPRKGTSLPVCH